MSNGVKFFKESGEKITAICKAMEDMRKRALKDGNFWA